MINRGCTSLNIINAALCEVDHSKQYTTKKVNTLPQRFCLNEYFKLDYKGISCKENIGIHKVIKI